jgi:riboflavin synthase
MTDSHNMMEEYIRGLIKDELMQQMGKLDVTLKEEEASRIVLAIIPHIDELIAKRVKQHFVELADLIKEKFEK